MSTEFYFPSRTSQRWLRVGPLAGVLDRFATRLKVQGYARPSAVNKLRLVSNLSRWLHHQGLGVEALDEPRVAEFVLTRGPRGVQRGDATTVRQLLSHLRASGRIPLAAPSPQSSNPFAPVECRYERFLFNERGVSRATVENYLPIIHTLLAERFATGAVALDTLTVRDVNHFIVRQSQHLSRSRAKLLVTALRSFLRHLHQRADIPADLASALPPFLSWRLSGVPKSLAPEQVEAIIESCDLRTAAGRRDRAILLLLARLGLRAGEVAAMALDDLDWDSGVVSVSGKGQRREALPLPRWTTEPHDAQPAQWAGRLSMVRGFARYAHGVDPRHEVPPPGLLSERYRRRQPYLYRDTEVAELIAAARELSATTGLRPLTYATMLGLLSVTGMRVSEVVNLDRDDVDLAGGVLTVRDSKFGKSRYLPVHESTTQALHRYARRRDRLCRNPRVPAFFLAERGTRITQCTLRRTFAKLSKQVGLRTPSKSHGIGPRLHDMRHRYLLACHFTPSYRATDVTAALDGARAEAERLHGGPLLKSPFLVTDNGSSFLARAFRRHIDGDYAHVRIRYRTPTQLGLLERFHQTLKTEEVYWKLYASPGEARESLEVFRRRYNEVRPHWALVPPEGGDPVTPAEVYVQGKAVGLPKWQGWAKAARKKLNAIIEDAHFPSAPAPVEVAA